MNTRIARNNARITRIIASIHDRHMLTLFVLLTLFGLSVHTALGQGAFTLNAQINVAPQGTSAFAFTGTNTLLGQYRCQGEVSMYSSKDTQAHQGTGVAVFVAANGDRLVGMVSLQTNADGAGQMTFTWCSSVRSSNGTVFYSTGQFAKSRPATVISPIRTNLLVVIAIIAILIGL